jgi:RNA polymerase sigma-70 factor (ECF subfamily)
MVASQPDTGALIQQASRGDGSARQQLLVRHRGRLRQMVAIRLDRRLAKRVDPSDIVQEALTDAAQNLSDYLRDRPLPFYPWLRQFAWQRLLMAQRHHIKAQRRSVLREQADDPLFPDQSAAELADRLFAGGTSPSQRLIRSELRRGVQEALGRLSPSEREILIMRHLEELSATEIGAVLEISPGAVRARLFRALERLRALRDESLGEVGP